MKGALYRNEVVYDSHNSSHLSGDGVKVHAAGEVRLLSRTPEPPGHNRLAYSAPFESAFPIIPRSEWSARCKEQLEQKRRTSDFQNFPPHNQGSNPTCWANGPAHAATTQRVIQGLPYVELSADSVALVGASGHAGGFEGNAFKWASERGWCSTDVWANNLADKSLLNDPKCNENRKHHVALELLDLGSDIDKFATACLLNLGIGGASNSWSHVTMVCDLVEIEPGSFGFRHRNNWGNWGASNDYGQPGYAVFRIGAPHCCTDSGWAIRQITSSIA